MSFPALHPIKKLKVKNNILKKGFKETPSYYNAIPI